jgi:hypothetical protein
MARNPGLHGVKENKQKEILFLAMVINWNKSFLPSMCG